jgi:hypothetical protein
MTAASTIEVRGEDGADPGAPVDGKPALPLVDGNGKPGKASEDGDTCLTSATNGHPGNGGGTAPPAVAGANADNAPSVTLQVVEFRGAGLTVTVSGGKGGRGVSGGQGGAGGDGGDAGTQPRACVKKYTDSIGGAGGRGGDGGTAGDGGNAGSGGIASLLWAAMLGPDFHASVTCTAGLPGNPGDPGDPGDPGEGGLNGDGVTRAHAGYPASGGGLGKLGHQGRSGSGTSTSVKAPQVQVQLFVVPM